MPRHRRAPRPPPIDDRDLAAEVLYLHSLWRCGPPARAPVPVPAAANQSRPGRRRPRNRKRRRSGRGASDSEDAGPGSPRAPSPDASASASPAESTPPPSPAPVPAAPNQTRSGRRRGRRGKRRRSGCGAADAEDAAPGSPHAPSPPFSPDASAQSPPSGTNAAGSEKPDAQAWPDVSASASPAESTPPPSPAPVPAAPNQTRSGRRRGRRGKRRRSGRGNADAAPGSPHATSPPASPDASAPSPPRGTDAAASEKPHAQAWPDAPTSSAPPPPSPGALAHREALRAAADFFTSHGSDGEEEDDEEVSESEGDEEEAAEFFTGMFERDAALRSHYERGWEDWQFACMACAAKGKARRGTVRRFRGCVGLVQHARAATRFGRPGAHRALAAVVCRVLGWDIDRLPSIVIDPRGTLSLALAARAQSQSDVQKAKETVEPQMGGSNTNGDEVANQLVTSKESAGMNDVEEIGPLNSEDNSKDNVCSHETNQEEDAVKTGMEEHLSIDGEKVATGLDGDRESSEKDNSLSKVNNGVIHEQDIAKESTEKENMKNTLSTEKCKNENSMKASDQEEVNTAVSEPEQAKTTDGIGLGDTVVAKLGNNPTIP